MILQRIKCLNNLFINNTKRLFSVSSVSQKSFRKWYRDFWTPKPIHAPPYDHVTQVGDPVLRTKAATVPEELIGSKEIEFVIQQMIKALRKYDCVGISAPQIGVSLRIIAMEFREQLRKKFTKTDYQNRKMSTLPLTILINPVMKITNYEKFKHAEGCMSVRGYSAEVERYDGVTLSGFNQAGDIQELQLSGWNARIAQHEIDHLNGTLYLDNMDCSTFKCTCWETVNSKGGRVEIPFYK